MKEAEQKPSQDIVVMSNPEQNELLITLSEDGIEYLQNILSQLKSAEVESHWHIDDFSGWLGGEFAHLIVMKKAT